MARALQLAERGRYSTHPNPRVGCVLVNNGQTVGEGWHRRAGEPHAEVNALRQAGEAARGATVYVTLEPCCHHGRTPPCSQALVDAGVARVVAAMRDPNPRVDGGGLEQIRSAGIVVESGLLEIQARRLNRGFISRMERGRPYLRIKSAASLDGRTAMASGESQWVTGADARREVHRMRAESAAVLTGSGTVLADDPSMNVRLQRADLAGLDDDLPMPTPVRVVLDSRLRVPPGARMLGLPGQTLIYSRLAGERPGAEVTVVGAVDGGLDLSAVLTDLGKREINEVLVEAGPTLAGALLAAGLADELVLFLAPHLMGDDARGLFHLPGIARMDQRVSLTIDDIRCVGADWRITALPART
ncbi:MAG: bifunctional diaminohydroxyphosphoribosylaminopyrimidine deaminase/5-amino-6-(5-phosphoribosylamino)uracil reductase RibD [Chromatiales bacterium]|nr:bifunctional diaminohydroxyphosphoribosylaminopyrimidine deaminase/5-amino-6-(5-phosphoribosylamino)uracil reductase RibD [Chromatiales bacterium]